MDGAVNSGTVRLGLRIVPVSVLSAAQFSSLATVCFLMLATAIVGYFLISLGIKRLTNLRDKAGAPLSAPERGSANAGGIVPAVQQLDRAVTQFLTPMNPIRSTANCLLEADRPLWPMLCHLP